MLQIYYLFCILHCFYYVFQVSDLYEEVYRQMTSSVLRDYVPSSWVSMIQVKHNYFTALAHFNVATGLIDQDGRLKKSVIQIRFRFSLAQLLVHFSLIVSPDAWQSLLYPNLM